MTFSMKVKSNNIIRGEALWKKETAKESKKSLKKA